MLARHILSLLCIAPIAAAQDPAPAEQSTEPTAPLQEAAPDKAEKAPTPKQGKNNKKKGGKKKSKPSSKAGKPANEPVNSPAADSQSPANPVLDTPPSSPNAPASETATQENAAPSTANDNAQNHEAKPDTAKSDTASADAASTDAPNTASTDAAEEVSTPSAFQPPVEPDPDSNGPKPLPGQPTPPNQNNPKPKLKSPGPDASATENPEAPANVDPEAPASVDPEMNAAVDPEASATVQPETAVPARTETPEEPSSEVTAEGAPNPVVPWRAVKSSPVPSSPVPSNPVPSNPDSSNPEQAPAEDAQQSAQVVEPAPWGAPETEQAPPAPPAPVESDENEQNVETEQPVELDEPTENVETSEKNAPSESEEETEVDTTPVEPSESNTTEPTENVETSERNAPSVSEEETEVDTTPVEPSESNTTERPVPEMTAEELVPAIESDEASESDAPSEPQENTPSSSDTEATQQAELSQPGPAAESTEEPVDPQDTPPTPRDESTEIDGAIENVEASESDETSEVDETLDVGDESGDATEPMTAAPGAQATPQDETTDVAPAAENVEATEADEPSETEEVESLEAPSATTDGDTETADTPTEEELSEVAKPTPPGATAPAQPAGEQRREITPDGERAIATAQQKAQAEKLGNPGRRQLLRCLPENSVMVASIHDLDGIRSSADGNSWFQFFEDEQVRPVVEFLMGEIERDFAEGGEGSEELDPFAFFSSIHGSLFGFLAPVGKDMEPGFGILIDPGEDRAEFDTHFEMLLQAMSDDAIASSDNYAALPLQVFQANDRKRDYEPGPVDTLVSFQCNGLAAIVGSNGVANTLELAHGIIDRRTGADESPGMAQNSWLRKARTAAGSAQPIEFFVDVGSVLDITVDSEALAEDEMQVFEMLGLFDMHWVYATAGLGQGEEMDLRLNFHLPRTGALHSLLELFGPLPVDLGRFMPSQSSSIGFFSFDVWGMYETVMGMIEDNYPERYPEMRQQIDGMAAMMGIDFEQDFLAQLTGDFGSFSMEVPEEESMMDMGGLFFGGAAVDTSMGGATIIGLKDTAAVDGFLEGVIAMTGLQQMIQSEEFMGVPVQHLAGPDGAFGVWWSFLEDACVFSFYPTAVRTALRNAGETDVESATDNERFQTALARLGTAPMVSLTDTKTYVRTMLSFGNLFEGMASGFDQDSSFSAPDPMLADKYFDGTMLFALERGSESIGLRFSTF